MKFTEKYDMHIVRYFSSWVTISAGKVVNVTEPVLKFCPLANSLYDDFRSSVAREPGGLRDVVRGVIESKIKEYGFFTSRRNFFIRKVSIPYGASEMLMFALNKKVIDAAVTVCDGAGTVITDEGMITQGIGARMHSLVRTSPIPATMSRLQAMGARVVSGDAKIDQLRGVKKAIELGYKRIAVTVRGFDSQILQEIRDLESLSHTKIIVLVVCTTGVSVAQVEQIRRDADIVWSCASAEVRETIGEVAVLQISKHIPVFVLTSTGIDFVAAYSDSKDPFCKMAVQRQYLISTDPPGRTLKMGGWSVFLREEELPSLKRKQRTTASV
jgi:putative methanogenesis marker protein 8